MRAVSRRATERQRRTQLNATPGGVPGGTGTKPGPAAPSAPQLSREASLSGGREWDCPWPPEANEDQIDFQRVSMMVTVRADGTVQDARIANDPGHGFGRMARQCAFRQRFDPALDRAGKPVLSTLRLGVTFQR
jgi:protein TonB